MIDTVGTAINPDPPAGTEARTADRHRLWVRPAGPGDLDALVALHTRLCPESLYLRFLGSNRVSAAHYAAHLAEPATTSHQAMTGWWHDDLVGVASYEQSSDTTAELAVLVADGWHEKGIGTILTRRLAEVARSQGISVFEADVLGGNALAHRLLQDLGFAYDVHYEGSVARFVVHLDRPKTTIH